MYNTAEETSRVYELKKLEFEAMVEASKNGSNNVKNTTDKTLSSVAISQPLKPAVNDSTAASQPNNVETKIEAPCAVMSSVVEEVLSLAETSEDEEACELPDWELNL
ncbi:hypothetical protein L6452_05160 [Arctium lappa]|uniref:Uncharacterized protein n=1 Tax=Arctium lappa TaxID=4217 RepID=A0ACB9EGB0_ARCLA|nr:hypothetical protein L6452_05160 [Arctium lappa]